MTTLQPRQRARLLVGLEAFVAVGAWAGTVGFLSGDFDTLAAQLPWHSAALGAVALAACVGVPTTVATVALLRRWTWGRRAALLSAAILMGWLVGQTLIIGFSAFQPAYLLIAGWIAWLAAERTRAHSVG